eukprot:TRINITY_DN6531_c0_g1_i2.p1 TRINITY_DN6531_c0_g1~~TRINITY_DN6531_c0_g1_i2.p1  ORF type:complete len:118 (-),score=5.70 TRINITY_DN6531_c0_g1_i2:337-690(-)
MMGGRKNCQVVVVEIFLQVFLIQNISQLFLVEVTVSLVILFYLFWWIIDSSIFIKFFTGFFIYKSNFYNAKGIKTPKIFVLFSFVPLSGFYFFLVFFLYIFFGFPFCASVIVTKLQE